MFMKNSHVFIFQEAILIKLCYLCILIILCNYYLISFIMNMFAICYESRDIESRGDSY